MVEWQMSYDMSGSHTVVYQNTITQRTTAERGKTLQEKRDETAVKFNLARYIRLSPKDTKQLESSGHSGANTAGQFFPGRPSLSKLGDFTVITSFSLLLCHNSFRTWALPSNAQSLLIGSGHVDFPTCVSLCITLGRIDRNDF